MPGFNVGIKVPGCNIQAPSFEDDILSNTVETARSNRFKLLITTPVGSINGNAFSDRKVSLSCETISRPSVRIEKELVYNGSDYINVPLRAKFDPIELVLYEILSDSNGILTADQSAVTYNKTAFNVLTWWVGGVFNHYRSRTAVPSARRSTVEILMLNGAGYITWGYRLHRAWPEFIEPSGSDYKSGAISKIKMTVCYDKLEEINPTINQTPNLAPDSFLT